MWTAPQTHLQAAFPAVLHHQTNIRWLHANPEELHQVLVFHLFHLSPGESEVWAEVISVLHFKCLKA